MVRAEVRGAHPPQQVILLHMLKIHVVKLNLRTSVCHARAVLGTWAAPLHSFPIHQTSLSPPHFLFLPSPGGEILRGWA